MKKRGANDRKHNLSQESADDEISNDGSISSGQDDSRQRIDIGFKPRKTAKETARDAQMMDDMLRKGEGDIRKPQRHGKKTLQPSNQRDEHINPQEEQREVVKPMKSAPVDKTNGYFHEKDSNNQALEGIASSTRAKRKKEGKTKERENPELNQEFSQASYLNKLLQDYRVYFSDSRFLENNQQPNNQKSNQVRTHRYSLYSWFPLSLLYQFKRFSNAYFLIISILTFLPFSPKNPASMVVTFALVLLFTMLKEAYEDYQRYKQDKEVNRKQATVFNVSSSKWETKEWMELQEGQIIRVHRNEEVPADTVLLITARQDAGMVHVETINLDGETNLKEKFSLFKPTAVPSEIKPGDKVDEEDMKFSKIFAPGSYLQESLYFPIKLNGAISCIPPNENLEYWNGIIYFKCDEQLKPKPANIKNLVLRGSIIRNTDYAIGIIVYSGMQTKIMKNLKKIPRKESNVMDQMNKMLYTVLLLQVLLVILISGLNLYWSQYNNMKYHSYLGLKSQITLLDGQNNSTSFAKQFFQKFLIYWVAYSHMIPISLYVVIELLKLGLASYINWDSAILVAASKQPKTLPITLSQQEQQISGSDVNENKREQRGRPEIPLKSRDNHLLQQCRNSDLIEELGQIQMIFCDKTGTLTQNQMIMRKCQINGIKYGDEQDESNGRVEKDEDGIPNTHRLPSRCRLEIHNTMRQEAQEETESGLKGNVTFFFEVLALCNQVLVDFNPHTNHVSFKSTSIDDLALVNSALENAEIQMISKDNVKREVKVYNKVTQSQDTYRIIEEFPFDGDRKRMSIILKNLKDKQVIMMSKGADMSMIDRIDFAKNDFEELKLMLEEDIAQYSKEGLRTLVIASKTFSRKDYKLLKRDLKKVSKLNGIEKEIRQAEIQNKYERNLKYIGVTAVEDKLQDGVPATIATLMKADMRFFILTGDKLESTIQIASAVNIINEQMDVITIQTTDRYLLDRTLTKLSDESKAHLESYHVDLEKLEMLDRVIAIDGPTLGMIQADADLETMFYHICIRSRSVLFCRLSPKQKADIVKIFRSRGDWITLAIGDGANDVSMLLEANIGVGIRGMEGNQVIRQADFAIGHFQQILRLLLFQGRTGYTRITQMVCFYLYKNVILVFTEFYFVIFNGFSGQNFFPDWLSMLYNILFSSWHCLIAFYLEKDANDHLSFRYSKIYQAGQLGKTFNFLVFWKWILMAMVHGAFCFYLPIISGTAALSDLGQRGEHWHHATTSFTVIIHLVFYKLLLETRHLNLYTVLTGILSLLIYYMVLFYFSEINAVSQALQPELQGVMQCLIETPNFWVKIGVTPLVCLVPDVLMKLLQKLFYPNPIDKVLQLSKEKTKISLADKNQDFLQLIENEKSPVSEDYSIPGEPDQGPRFIDVKHKIQEKILGVKDEGQERLSQMVGRGIQQQYDFKVDFEKLAREIELKKRTTAISNAQRRDQIASFKKKKEEQELKFGAGSKLIDSQENQKIGLIKSQSPDIYSNNSKLVTVPRTDDDNFGFSNNFIQVPRFRVSTMKEKKLQSTFKPRGYNRRMFRKAREESSQSKSSSLSDSSDDIEHANKGKLSSSGSYYETSSSDSSDESIPKQSNEQGQDNYDDSMYHGFDNTIRSNQPLFNFKEADLTSTTRKVSHNSINQGQHQFRLPRKNRKAAKEILCSDSDRQDHLIRSTIVKDVIKQKELYKLSIEVIDPKPIACRDQSDKQGASGKKRGVKSKISTLPIQSSGNNLEIAVNNQKKLNFYGPTPALEEVIEGPQMRGNQTYMKDENAKDSSQENIEKSTSSAFNRIQEEIKQDESIGESDGKRNNSDLVRPQELFHAMKEQGDPSGKPYSLNSQASKVHAEPHSSQLKQNESLNLAGFQKDGLVRKLKKKRQIQEVSAQNVKAKQPGVIQSQAISGRSNIIGDNTNTQDLSSIVGENNLEAGQQVISDQLRNLAEESYGKSEYSLPSHLEVAEIPDIELASERDQ